MFGVFVEINTRVVAYCGGLLTGGAGCRSFFDFDTTKATVYKSYLARLAGSLKANRCSISTVIATGTTGVVGAGRVDAVSAASNQIAWAKGGHTSTAPATLLRRANGSTGSTVSLVGFEVGAGPGAFRLAGSAGQGAGGAEANVAGASYGSVAVAEGGPAGERVALPATSA